MAELNQDKLNVTGKGINTDISPEFQPEGTQRFVLNGVNESDSGDLLVLSNEPGNVEVESLPNGFEIVSKLYLADKETVLFLTNNTGDSMISVFDAGTEKLTIYVDDTLSTDKLNFSHDFPIDAVYRLRRGCERMVYFTDYNNPPRVVNLDSLNDYLVGSLFSANKTNLFRSTSIRPSFKEITVIDSGGQMLPGTYNFAIQYVDESLNPTEWFTVSDTINIYNSSLNLEYKKIEGSINSTEDGLNFGATNKSVKIDVENLDPNFTYYRIAIIAATSGTGQITKIEISDIISIKKDSYIYTGTNYVTTTTVEEIISEKLIINKAEHILQTDNSLILGNTKGSEVPFCNLQQYASRIVSDVVVKKIVIDNIDSPHSSKNPTLHLIGQGYVPGEIYSFGVQYLFEDGELSPVYHIPGKAFIDADTVYSPGPDTFPMDANNISLNTRYIENNNCNEISYWGKDYRGKNLKNTFVRHHRFPTRGKLGLKLVELEDVNEVSEVSKIIKISYEGATEIGNETAVFPDTQLSITYSINGVLTSSSVQINYRQYYDGVNNTPEIEGFLELPTPPDSGAVVVISVEETSFIDNTESTFTFTEDATSTITNLSYGISVVDSNSTKKTKRYSTNILGIKFSNILLPDENITGKKVVGYYILRNERTDTEKTILDSAVLTNCITNNKYISHGLLYPETDVNRYHKTIFGLIHPQHKFFEKNIQGFTSIIQEGTFDIVSRKKSIIRYEDVVDGSSYDSEVHNKNEKDDDGMDLKIGVRDNEVDFRAANNYVITNNEVEDIFYLSALEYRDINLGNNTIYNIAGDNKVGILQLKNEKPGLSVQNNQAQYVIFKRDNLDSYSNFRNLEYYLEHTNYQTGENITLFHGDNYISPMRYANTVFWDIQITKRGGKSSFWKKLGAIVLVVAGVALSIFSGGGSLALVAIGAGILVAGTGIMMMASGLKTDAINKAYGEEYDKGLRETALDNWVMDVFRKRNGEDLVPGDDEIQWIGDVVSNFWFESSINVSLRNGFVGDLPAFLHAPGVIQDGNTTPETFFTKNKIKRIDPKERLPVSDVEFFFASKLLYFDPERKGGRAYLGHPLGEYYSINPDYLRRNKEKVFYHLPLEYDCCSECNEVFPHRWHWSQQSFQEELIDNYRVFLPNNYRDLDGETGEITNIFKINNDMFIHTQGALFNCPRNYQERITDQVVSFLGTGELFSISPQKISDSTIFTGGTNLKWARVKTIYGYFFVSDIDKAIYLFNGQNIKRISDKDMRKELSKLLVLEGNKNYYKLNGVNNPLLDKVSADKGLGFVLVYDEEYKRILITKKDYDQGLDYSFTLSYDLKTESWVSFHSYLPKHYIEVPQNFFSISEGKIYKHNIKGVHNFYYNTQKSFIIEYVSSLNPNVITTTENVFVPSTAFRFDTASQQYVEVDNIFFNKLVAYNSRQSTGMLELVVKNDNTEDFFSSSIKNLNNNQITVSNKEHVWRLNELRDNRTNHNSPIFYDNQFIKQQDYFIDKVINNSSIDYNKDWSQKEMLRDRYLIVRLIFDNFANVKLVANITGKNETISIR